MSRAQDVVDDYIYHAHYLERYKTAQGAKTKRYLRMLNKRIADYLRRKRTLETRQDYRRTSFWIKEQVKDFAEQMLKIVEKDIRAMFDAEWKWVQNADTANKELKQPSKDRVVNDVLFNAFNDTYTVEGFINTIAERVYKAWDSQMRVAVTTKVGMDWVIEQVLGE